MDNKRLLEDLTLVMIYLTSWQEGKGEYGSLRAWRSYDWDALDALHEAGLIGGNRKAKSVYLSEEGAKLAKELLGTFGFESTQEQQGDKAFKFHIALDFDELTCWREVIVPAHISFFDLHLIIQSCFNWLDYHLYDFTLKSGGKELRIGELNVQAIDSMFDFFGSDEPKLDASKLLLDEVFPKTKTATYAYDYGDGWIHKIKLIDVVGESTKDLPKCTDGKGDAPPEDVGAEWGFQSFLEAIEDRKNPEHTEMVEWGESQQFERLNLKKTNQKLKNWKYRAAR
jgi:hypothetical protein